MHFQIQFWILYKKKIIILNKNAKYLSLRMLVTECLFFRVEVKFKLNYDQFPSRYRFF